MPDLISTLYYIHDPMCSWCWAYRPVMLQLRKELPGGIQWQNVLGGLAADNDQPMPEQTREMIKAHWRQIESTLGTKFNFNFWADNQPRRDTYKACRAVIAASYQYAEEAMIESIQKAYYLQAMNPSDPSVLAGLAAGLGLDRVLFETDLISSETEKELHRQLMLRDRLGVKSFPSLVFERGSVRKFITHDYRSSANTLAEITRQGY